MRSILYDVNGKRAEAKTVFAHSIRFLRDEAVNFIRQETRDDGFKVDDILWVLTVPAIWTPRTKQFMREAAYEVKFKYCTGQHAFLRSCTPVKPSL